MFAGSAEYTVTLPPVENPDADAWALDLGDVRESAALWLDGEPLGTLFKAPWTVVLTPEQAARGGELTIRVSNLATNRISDMDRRGEPWKIFYNANIQPRIPISRGPEGFSAARWELRESGLMGPVTLTALKLD